MMMRLDRLLSNLGYCSRREAGDLTRSGAVILDGQALLDASKKINISQDLPERMTVQGQPIDPPPGLVLILHKPPGVTCSHKESGPLVYDLLPQRWRRREPPISTIGRLDKDTSGLLLLTDDGAFLHRIISPKSLINKVYLSHLARPLKGDEATIFASGTLMLESETTPLAPADLVIIGDHSARLTLTEGRYHQVRRMFAAVGNHVESLHRQSLGPLGLAGLEPGEWRLLTTAEKAALTA